MDRRRARQRRRYSVRLRCDSWRSQQEETCDGRKHVHREPPRVVPLVATCTPSILAGKYCSRNERSEFGSTPLAPCDILLLLDVSIVSEELPLTMPTAAGDAGYRLDQFLATHLNVSRARVQQLISREKVLVNDAPAKASFRLRGGEAITILGEAHPRPLKAIAEEIPLNIVYEDDDVAVINKPAGMMVHAGAGASDDARNRGTLVNALLHHMGTLSQLGGELRPGIVHRLDKETSGLIIVAKNDAAHRKLGEQFAAREVKKKYVALVHGWMKKDSGTIDQSISRDRVRRTRMTTRLKGGRSAITHYSVARRLETNSGKFTLLDIKIDTGRTHQIRVHLSSMGHSVVGDATYGAPREIKARDRSSAALSLKRNFLHAAELEFRHPRTGKTIALKAELPPELRDFLGSIEGA